MRLLHLHGFRIVLFICRSVWNYKSLHRIARNMERDLADFGDIDSDTGTRSWNLPSNILMSVAYGRLRGRKSWCVGRSTTKATRYADYHSPIRNLYHCGASTHPGGAVSAVPGHNAAREILADWRWKAWST